MLAESKTTLPQFIVQPRAVLYARVSGDDRKNATSSIEGQLKDCREYAGKKNYNIVGELFEEPNKHTSGYDWLPELEKMLNLAEQGFFDVLIVREIDRLARNRFKQLSIENRLEALGLQVEYANGQYNNDTTEGRLLKGIMGELAEYERSKIRERIARGKAQSLAKGNVHTGGSRAPYGYEIAKVDGLRQLAINEVESAIVLQVFDLYLNGNKTQAEIAAYLNNLNVPRPGKGKNHKQNTGRGRGATNNWSPANIHNILTNEVYMGKWHFNKTYAVKNPITGKRNMKPRPKSEWGCIEVPAIVTPGTFKAAQKQKQQNKRAKRPHRYDYLLGGLMKCFYCGYAVTGFTTMAGNSYYGCNARRDSRKYGHKCHESKNIRADLLDESVWNWIKSILLEPETLRRHLEDYQAAQAELKTPLLKMLESNQVKLAALQAKKARLIEAYTAGVLSLDDIATKKVDLEKQITELQEAIKALESELQPTILTEDSINQIQELTEKVRIGLDLATDMFEVKREIIELLKVGVRFRHAEGVFYADVTCHLGQKSVVPGSNVDYDIKL